MNLSHLLPEMVSSPWFWADVALGVSGGLVVWWGLKVEKAGEKLLPPSDFRPDMYDDIVQIAKRKMERGWRILMIGIVFEVVAALGISVISGLEIADLSDQTAIANHEAKQAENNAALAESNNLVLRLKLQPRSISAEQISNFIFLTEKIRKIPIRIHAAQQGDDTFSFAFQLRRMFDKAGFPRYDPGFDMAGVEINPPSQGVSAYIFRANDYTGEWPDVLLNTYGTNNKVPLYSIPNEDTNGFSRPIEYDPNPLLIYQAIGGCLNQIGITFQWYKSADWLTNGETEIFVPVKIN
jgi:hypothetical protein